jgi:uncharacterized protein (DUF342 family)
MNERETKKEELRQRSQESRRRADQLLQDELEALKNATRTDLEALRPDMTDENTYDELIAAIEEATRRNEDLAQLKERLEKLGSAAVVVAKKAVNLLGAV